MASWLMYLLVYEDGASDSDGSCYERIAGAC
jgi:hypothetical protein